MRGALSIFMSIKYVHLEEEDLLVLHISYKKASQCAFLTRQKYGNDSFQTMETQLRVFETEICLLKRNKTKAQPKG